MREVPKCQTFFRYKNVYYFYLIFPKENFLLALPLLTLTGRGAVLYLASFRGYNWSAHMHNLKWRAAAEAFPLHECVARAETLTKAP